jgi:hypothetical protein
MPCNGLFAKLIVCTHHGDDKPGLCRSRLQLLRAPLQNGIANGFGAVTAPQEIERPRVQPGVKIESHYVTPVARFTEERQFEEWVISIHAHRRRASVDRFPFPFEEAAEAPDSFPDVDMNVLSFARSDFQSAATAMVLAARATAAMAPNRKQLGTIGSCP